MRVICENLGFSYGEKRVLDGVNLSLQTDDRVALMGPSGCGKTTLLRLLAGLEQPQTGRLESLQERGVSMVFQENRLIPHLTALGNLALVAPKRPRAELLGLLEELGLLAAAEKYPAELSGGMKRRVAIARATTFAAPLWLLDEPFTGLDADSRACTAQFILRHSVGGILLAVLHDPAESALLEAKILRLAELED